MITPRRGDYDKIRIRLKEEFNVLSESFLTFVQECFNVHWLAPLEVACEGFCPCFFPFVVVALGGVADRCLGFDPGF